MKVIENLIHIHGPCSAESYEQLLEVAKNLCSQGVDKMRVGVWKPRSRPGSFEGMGLEALKWMQKIQNDLPITCYTEVMTPGQVDQCLTHGIKNFWIGARTSTNPIMVDEISRALIHDVNDVIVKNPLAPDLKLWVGAIERIMSSANINTLACLRGFSTYGLSGFRNEPIWELGIELRKYFDDLKIIVDPSHMAGKSELVHPLCQLAIDLNFDGLMIETHPNPELALSDSRQQLNFIELKQILNNIKLKKVVKEDSQLKEFRDELDKIDNELIELIGSREKVIKEVAKYKFDHGLQIIDIERFYSSLNQKLEYALENNIDKDIIEKIFRLIHSSSLSWQSSKNKS